ncbi:DinB family protein [Micromonospora lutea]|nr:DinB family protein [Micromonospora lutea]
MKASTGGERVMLDAFLDFHRFVLLRKLQGISDADAARRLVPSATTLAGLVKHLTMVERNWFRCLLAPGPEDVYLTSEQDAADSFALTEDDSVERLSAAYAAECARSREIAGRFELDHVVPHPQLGEVSLRWVLVHLIEETARHVGHADILRELTDGSTGAI